MKIFIFLLQKAACHAPVVKKRNGKYSRVNCREVNKQMLDRETTGELLRQCLTWQPQPAALALSHG